MIGLFKSMDCEISQARSDEDSSTKHMDKSELYEALVQDYCLPPLHSRGITRDYLLNVHRCQVYTVGHTTLKQFEVNLTVKMSKKVGVINSGLLVRKLNILLKSKDNNELGFDEYDPPDQVAYLKVGMALESRTVHRQDQCDRDLRRFCC